jgi:hypothetical protein
MQRRRQLRTEELCSHKPRNVWSHQKLEEAEDSLLQCSLGGGGEHGGPVDIFISIF